MIKTTNRLYMDNAATSFPKPSAVHEAMAHYAKELGASPGRGAYRESRQSAQLLQQCRQQIATLINCQNPNHIIFTLNCTDSLNIAIKGIVRQGDHVITTQLEHNSILRPLNELQTRGVITQTRVPIDPITGLTDPDDIRKAIQPNTRLIAMLHGSNVTGTLQDIKTAGQIAREHQIIFLVDAAQSLGHYPIDVQALNIDLLAAPGHKGLLGPLGTGFLYIRPSIEKKMTTLREGGTGSVSELDTHPTFMPDKFEAGSHNTIGIIGLLQGVNYLLDRGVEDIWKHESALIKTMIESLTQWGEMPGFHLYGPQTVKNRCAVFSIRIDHFNDPLTLSNYLEQNYGILTRPGLHCAPNAHTAIGTAKLGGTTRLSLGPFLSLQDVKFAADAIAQTCHTYAKTKAS